MVSSISGYVNGRSLETSLHVTTPDSFKIQRLLKKAVSGNDKYFIIESTSHALDQHRLWGIYFDVSVITNITSEHLDYHKEFHRYTRAKAKLLLNSAIALINRDDTSYDILSEYLKKRKKRYFTYSLTKKADFNFDTAKKLNISIEEFNNYNFLAAYSVLKSLKIPEKDIISGFTSFKLPEGRVETVFNKDYRIIIDFAHTPNSFENILKSINKIKKNRIIHIFGSAGLRDAIKRPLLGRVSSKYSDVIILTEEDYRTEDPERIMEGIAKGINSNFKFIEAKDLGFSSRNVYTKIVNRAEAVRRAISIVTNGDILIFTGKSHEKSLARGKIEYPWNEKSTILKFLKK
ncbi:hypothetical protein A3F29_01510 [Candidatus Roizmanbacteria bacterium RIFCSPHIGHO2_12_FULL_33_9]|uniref:Mur ligase central domain-containing protein n=1 Tax=Candidatus Roizmanbacteria bacterium RIFCSPHIGHO2_12_FULL_33_9 TaxID=1802045 RepID=A0A1F7HJH2_9BACT|nr:MAG: hypothetical protein A3F29_01510 [Candidatus Roizmanbacteria bacterium RIFCSPHIGHO2_12_FULL_33_9]